MDDNKKLAPGDAGYKGGEYTATMVIGGKSKDVRVRKNANGDIVYMGVSDKVFGIF